MSLNSYPGKSVFENRSFYVKDLIEFIPEEGLFSPFF